MKGSHAATIINAIKTRTPLVIEYLPGWRHIEPYAIGFGRRGQWLIRAYQTRGVSRSAAYEGWKTFRVDRIRSIEVPASWMDDTFDGSRPGFHLGSQFHRIIARVGE